MDRKILVGIDAHAIGRKQGGNETYALGLLHGLVEISPSDFRFLVFLSRYTDVPRFLQAHPLFDFDFVSTYAGMRIFQLSRKAAERKVALLHTQYHIPFFCPCPSVITFHDVSFLRHPEFFPRFLYCRLKFSLPYAVHRAKKIITVSEFSRKEILTFYNIPANKVRKIYNGYSAVFKPVTEERKPQLKKFGISRPYILSVSNLQPRKNITRLIQAFLSLAKSDKTFLHDLVIVGRKLWLYDSIFNEVRKSGYENRIIFTDYVPEEDLVVLYNFADCLVYPSLYEGFGLPVLEAMACGCPVITSSTSSLPEIAGSAGILVDPYRSEEIAHAIRKLVADPQLRKKLRDAGLKQAEQFSWRIAAKQTMEIYREVLSLKGGNSGEANAVQLHQSMKK